MGLAGSGSGLGQFIMVNITGVLLLTVGWRDTLKYLALIQFLGLLLCAFLVKRFLPIIKVTTPVIEDAAPNSPNTSSPPTSLWSSSVKYIFDTKFLLLFFGYLIAVFGFPMPFVHLPEYCILHGLTSSQAQLLLSIIGIASAAGRVGSGMCLTLLLIVLANCVCLLDRFLSGLFR